MDSGWLAILKASAWQLLGLSLALSIFWLLLRSGTLPPSESSLVIYGLPMAILVTAGLGLASLLEKIFSWAEAGLTKWLQEKEQKRKIEDHQRKFLEHIAYMTKNELRIYGYLLKHRQKSFTAEMDGGHASSLYNRGFIQSDAQYGHSHDMSAFPFSVPDHIWLIAEENRDRFPSEFPDRKLPWVRSNW